MKRALAGLLVLLSLCWAADARFPRGTPSPSGPVNMGGGPNMLERSVFGSSTPTLPYSQWYVPGNGSPAISTSDYFLTNGFYWSRPYDLDTMGAEGAAIKAREGYRYAWIICSDHTGNFAGSADVFVAYSNDPQVLPEPTTMRSLIPYQSIINVVDQNGYTQNNFYPYQVPHMVYNPDTNSYSGGDKFNIYMEGVSTSSTRQHELALITSADLLTATVRGPTIPTTNFQGWSSYGKPERLGVNNWEVYALGKPDATATTVGNYKYTSTDGWIWTSTFTPQALYINPVVTIAGQDWMINKESGTANDYLVLDSVNANRQYTGTTNRISTGFGPSYGSQFVAGTAYPGPTYFQDTEAYSEDGVTTIYLSRGFPVAGHDGTNVGPYLENSPSFYTITGQVTGCPGACLLDVQTMPGGVPPLAVGFRVDPGFNSGRPSITSFAGGSGGLGTYNMSGGSNLSSGTTLTVTTNGGLYHQFIDLYYLVTDPTAAASAAPLGVKASCAAGVATIQWNNSLPHQNYRIYKGSSAGTQATLVNTISGTSITDTPTANAQTWYKVVTMNVTEQKSRVVNVYCSANTAMVNKHVNRVINDGGTGYDISFIATADSWLTSNNTYRYLQWWTDVRFGYKLDGSGFISRVYDLGTTLLPRGGDYTPSTSTGWPSTSSNTSYSATSFRGTTPSWVNNATSAHGYFGNGRTNSMQRWKEITLLAAYQKPGTAALGLFGYGEFNGMYLRHESGSSGNVTFALTPNPSVNTYQTATAPFSTATAAHVAAGTLDSGGNIKAYLDGVLGTTVNDPLFVNPIMANNTILRGSVAVAASNVSVLASGGTSSVRKPNYAISNEALGTFGGLGVFNKDIGQTLVQSWGALYN